MAWNEQTQKWLLTNWADIASVILRTERSDTEITYEVVVVDRVMSAVSCETGDDERLLWVESVAFGQTDATVAGGAAFVQMAREQQRIADETWHRKCGASLPEGGS